MELDTISAIATAEGMGGIGIIRLSGDKAIAVASLMFKPASGKRLDSYATHQAVFGYIIDDGGEVVDEALAIIMRAPKSYTKEDVVELQCHGGVMPLRRTLSLTLANGARLAEPGEFTKRAFLNGRLDLSQAQAVMDIVSAKTIDAMRAATGHLMGNFSSLIHDMRHTVLGEIAHLEAAIDFPEDEVDDVVVDEVEKKIVAIRTEIRKLLKTAGTGKILREGVKTAIVGCPNVGKSSLLNALLREERAIVTDIAGTTRDSIEEYAAIGGVPLRIIDTAGIRETSDTVEKIGVDRAKKCLDSADLVLAIFDGSRELTADDFKILTLTANRRTIIIINKMDLASKISIQAIEKAAKNPLGIIKISTKTRAGIEKLEDIIKHEVYNGSSEPSGFGEILRDEREVEILRRADNHLQAALKTIGLGIGLDFISIDLRSAWEALGELTGETVGEDIIDEIFSKFCIGK